MTPQQRTIDTNTWPLRRSKSVRLVGPAIASVMVLSACTTGERATSAPAGSSVEATNLAEAAASQSEGSEIPAESVAAGGQGFETLPTSEDTSETSLSPAKPLAHAAEAVAVTFDSLRSEPRPLKETVVDLATTSDVLSMKIGGFSYRGVVCGFTMQGEAPPSPVTIRQIVQTPKGTFDSGPIEVRWTKLANDAVTSGESKDGAWNFNSAANQNRAGKGWVVSVGGVTFGEDDDQTIIPTDGSCELRSKSKVFGPKTGPVGFWAGYATR